MYTCILLVWSERRKVQLIKVLLVSFLVSILQVLPAWFVGQIKAVTVSCILWQVVVGVLVIVITCRSIIIFFRPCLFPVPFHHPSPAAVCWPHVLPICHPTLASLFHPSPFWPSSSATPWPSVHLGGWASVVVVPCGPWTSGHASVPSWQTPCSTLHRWRCATSWCGHPRLAGVHHVSSPCGPSVCQL